jgi:hypothetical protein
LIGCSQLQNWLFAAINENDRQKTVLNVSTATALDLIQMAAASASEPKWLTDLPDGHD